MITITPAARDHIQQLLTQHEGQVLVLGVNNKGCSGHSYTFELKHEHELHKWDERMSVNGHMVAIDGQSVLKLIHSTLDYQSDVFGSRFVWHNPAVKHMCGCGVSVGF